MTAEVSVKLGSMLHSKSGVSNVDRKINTAIDAFQHLLFDSEAKSKIFPLMLEHIKTITVSDYSTMFINNSASDSANTLDNISAAEESNFIDPSIINHWFNIEILPTAPVFFNHPIPEAYQKLLLNPENISSLMILPVVSHVRLRGLCIVAKKQGSYSSEMVRRFMPLLGSVVCALQSADSIKSNLLNISPKIADNALLSSVLSNSLLGVLVTDKHHRIVVNNYEANQMLINQSEAPFNGSSLIGKQVTELIPMYEEMAKWSELQSIKGVQLSEVGPHVWTDQKVFRADGVAFNASITIVSYRYRNSYHSIIQLQNTSEVQQRSQEFKKTSQRLSALMQLVPVGIIQVNTNWECVFANKKWCELTGLNEDEVKGTSWINALHQDDVQDALELLRSAMVKGRELKIELRLSSPRGHVRWMEFNAQTLFDEEGAKLGFLATFADITERLINQERLRHIAEYDELTGLANRALFNKRLSESLFSSKADELMMAVLFIDLDGFKDINDSLGHAIGDKLLQRVAERILNSCKRTDTVARFGGDEFVVLIPDIISLDEASRLADKVVKMVAQPCVIEGNDIYVTTSVGIASGKAGSTNPEKILKQADTALYFAKSEGKNNYRIYNDDLNSKANLRIQLTHQLKAGLQQHSYHLAYQPLALVADRALVGFEALIRFTDNNQLVISPVDFIPILEESGMIIDVGGWVIEEVCRQMRAWIDQGLFPENGFMAINVSPKQLLNDSVLDILSAACTTYQIKPSQLVVELTESVLIDNPDKVKTILDKLKRFGVRLSLDDFGTGYSSLSYLQCYPFDHLKIDRSFITNLTNDVNDRKITKSIIALAQSLDITITAEGVEDESTLDVLSRYQADYYQGYFLGKPLVPDDAEAMMQLQ